ncbi:uncharacterized protein LOC117204670 [Bombus bifarius]|uniref:Uncharacterized protein LOC117204670 n=2 Tax=Pyrobombus TaxID=144703 RepID=A0A6P8LDH1_9HYME|nr:uncharacterized protein LOC117204670 [Bombus bifarius]
MLKQITAEKVIHITWLSVVISLCWPLPINSNRNKIFCFKILQICSGISGCLLFMPILYSIYLHLNDIVITSSCMCLLLGVSQNIFQTLICFIKHDSLQRTVEEMMTYVKEAQQYEKKIFYKYIKKCYVFCGGSMACTYVTATCFSLRPIILPVSLPFDAEYPFPINYTSMYVIIYMHHACLCIQTAAHVCVSSFGALLLWFTVARFECLAAELERSTDIDALVVCNVPLFVKLQFIGVCVTVLMEIYLYAWPADYLKDMSMDAPQSIYNSTWYEQKLGMQKSLLNVLIYRQPLTLSIACIVPELSLRYYCSYLSNAFSMFTTLRVMIHN